MGKFAETTRPAADGMAGGPKRSPPPSVVAATARWTIKRKKADTPLGLGLGLAGPLPPKIRSAPSSRILAMPSVAAAGTGRKLASLYNGHSNIQTFTVKQWEKEPR